MADIDPAVPEALATLRFAILDVLARHYVAEGGNSWLASARVAEALDLPRGIVKPLLRSLTLSGFVIYQGAAHAVTEAGFRASIEERRERYLGQRHLWIPDVDDYGESD